MEFAWKVRKSWMKIFIALCEGVPKESRVIEKKRKDFFAAKGFLTVEQGEEGVGLSGRS